MSRCRRTLTAHERGCAELETTRRAGVENIEQAGLAGAAQCRYRYELVISGKSGKQFVESEALYYWPSSATRKVRLFERNSAGEVIASKAFGLSGYRQALEKVLRADASVIATLAQLEHGYSQQLWHAASLLVSNILVEKYDGSDDAAIRHYAANPDLVAIFNREIQRIDVGIREMRIEQGNNGPVALFEHEGLALPMPIVYESPWNAAVYPPLSIYPRGTAKRWDCGSRRTRRDNSSASSPRNTALVLRPRPEPTQCTALDDVPYALAPGRSFEGRGLVLRQGL
jgi:hypothetical protein